MGSRWPDLATVVWISADRHRGGDADGHIGGFVIDLSTKSLGQIQEAERLRGCKAQFHLGATPGWDQCHAVSGPHRLPGALRCRRGSGWSPARHREQSAERPRLPQA